MNRYASKPDFLLGLVGQDIAGSRSPEMHMREAEALGARCVYRLVDFTALELDATALLETLAACERLGFDGVNVTHPFKQAIVPLLDELSDDARVLGAVNTVQFRGGRRIGHNTDWSGFAEPFRRRMADVRRERVVQLGAGGAGLAVGYAALTLGVERLIVFDVDRPRATHLAATLCAHFGPGRASVGGGLEDVVVDAQGLINATPVGMEAHPGLPLPADLLRRDLWVAEVIYFPLETALLRAARALGARTLDGGGMAVFQAAGAFRLFTGLEPDGERMLSAFTDMGV